MLVLKWRCSGWTYIYCKGQKVVCFLVCKTSFIDCSFFQNTSVIKNLIPDTFELLIFIFKHNGSHVKKRFGWLIFSNCQTITKTIKIETKFFIQIETIISSTYSIISSFFFPLIINQSQRLSGRLKKNCFLTHCVKLLKKFFFLRWLAPWKFIMCTIIQHLFFSSLLLIKSTLYWHYKIKCKQDIDGVYTLML